MMSMWNPFGWVTQAREPTPRVEPPPALEPPQDAAAAASSTTSSSTSMPSGAGAGSLPSAEPQAGDELQPLQPAHQAFALGSAVLIPRSHGGRSVGFILKYHVAKRVYTVELDEVGSGHCKLATEDFLMAVEPSVEPTGASSAARGRADAEPVAVG